MLDWLILLHDISFGKKEKKFVRLLVLLSAKISGGVTDRTYRGATLVELLHTATLIHDDVVDDADKTKRNVVNQCFV